MPLAPAILQRFSAYLKENGLKMTRQRQLILEEFFLAGEHLSAEDLYRRVHARQSKTGFVTVYRTLNLLVDCGLASRRDFGRGKSLFETTVHHPGHDHLICKKCGKIIEFSPKGLKPLVKTLESEHGFSVEHFRLELYGYCRECRSR